jgi:ATP-dependent Clp protease ATP-binding subunit ClpC
MNAHHVLDNLSTHLKNVIAASISFATTNEHPHVTPLHMLVSMLGEKGSIAAEILTKAGVQEQTIVTALSRNPSSQQTLPEKTGGVSTAVLPEFDVFAKSALEKAMVLAYEYGHSYIGTEHLLFGIVKVADKRITQVLKQNGLTKKEIVEHVQVVLQSTTRFPDVHHVSDIMEEIQDTQEKTKKHTVKQKSSRALDVFATHLTDPSYQKQLDPVIGREEEIERLIAVLSRRSKNNPVLVGEPGVGKTAIVEGLAKKIVEKDVPDILLSKKIYALDIAMLVSGTVYRGEFEARLKQVIEELSEEKDTILFIDEVHNIIGAGSNQGTMDAANMLKPALARGLLRCIGATTNDEYDKYIMSDAALERRFQSIYVDEPTVDDATKILNGLKVQYESFHRVRISRAAIDHAVHLSSTFIHDAFLPDKAIDLLDEACASVRMKTGLTETEKERQHVRQKIDILEKKKQRAVSEEAFEKAKKIKKTIQSLEKNIVALDQAVKKEHKKKGSLPAVSDRDIRRVLSKRLQIGEELLELDDLKRIELAEEAMQQHIYGQDVVIKQTMDDLRHAHLTNQAQSGPLASFLFVGPSGVGKTSFAKHLATCLYHDPRAYIKFDMSEFSEAHSVSKILGSPAGYVGHKERNVFTEKIKTRPHAVIVFDEIDKAHPDVTRLLFQILDEGAVTDSKGKEIRFDHAIVILTTNAGASFYTSTGIGFSGTDDESRLERQKMITSHMREVLDSALLGRIQQICFFDTLSDSAIQQIIASRIGAAFSGFTEKKAVNISTPHHVIETIAQSSFNKEEGARDVQQVVDTILRDVLISYARTSKQKKKQLTLEEQNGSYHLV